MDEARLGASLGKYELVAELARGGMGIVYLAHTGGVGGFKKLVVVKVLKPELADEESFRDMFLDEARLTARLNQRNIVQTNEVGMVDGHYFIAMDYLEGRALNRVTRHFGAGEQAVSQCTQLRILADTLAGLHYAHELADFDGTSLKIIHRDVCPQNVFITFDGQVKIVDFGVAKARNRLQETRAGTIKGRAAYMSPEQLTGTELDRRADIFSIGVMLWEILAGERMWAARSELETLKALVERKIPALPDRVDVPDVLRAMCARATDPEPNARFATAHELRSQIEQYLLRAAPFESLSDLGQRMSVAFASDREKLRRVVEDHVNKSGEANAGPADLTRLELKGVAGITMPVPSEPSLPKILADSNTPSHPSLPRLDRTSVTPSMTPSLGTPMNAELAAAVLPPTPQKRSAAVYMLGASVALVLVAGGWVAFGKTATPQAAAQPPQVASVVAPAPAPITSEAPKDDLVDVAINVTPPDAMIYIDDAQVPGNPFKARFPKGSHHKITATAVGYTAKTEVLDLISNTQASLSLEKTSVPVIIVRAPAGPAKTVAVTQPQVPTAAPVPQPTAAEINPKGGTVPLQKIDQKNPYSP